MSPQRRTALVSVGCRCVSSSSIKLVAGLASSSLGLLAEAAHSGTDLAAALLTFFAVSVAVRPADRGHPYGHAKAQNLAALAEAGFLILVSIGIAVTRDPAPGRRRRVRRRPDVVDVRRGRARARDRRVADDGLARAAPGSTAVTRCSPMRSTSGATSRGRSRSSPA